MCLGVSLQSCDSSEYTLPGPAGGDDVTGLSVGPTHYQLLSELGEEASVVLLWNIPQKRRRSGINPCIFTSGRGFNNLSQVRMGRHIATGQLVAIKQTNLDECTEEELLQLMVGCWI